MSKSITIQEKINTQLDERLEVLQSKHTRPRKKQLVQSTIDLKMDKIEQDRPHTERHYFHSKSTRRDIQ